MYIHLGQPTHSAFRRTLGTPPHSHKLAGLSGVVVSNGEFGSALAWFAKAAAVPDAVFWLLVQSPTFQSIVKTLDVKYLHLSRAGGVPTHWGIDWAPDAEGVFTKGPHIGRRMIEVRPSFEGSFFRPFGSPDGLLSADVIHLEEPTGRRTDLDQKGAWLEMIAHESIHAWRHVLGMRRAGKTTADRIRSGIDDEIATRKLERQIVDELRKKFPKFAAYKPTTGSFDPPVVERDFFPGKLRRTYLENFVFSDLIREAIKREKLSDTDIEAKNKEVDRIPLMGWRSRKFSSDYSKLRFWLRVIDFRWRKLNTMHQPGSPTFNWVKEIILQEHANAFFGGIIIYTPLPPSARPRLLVRPAPAPRKP